MRQINAWLNTDSSNKKRWRDRATRFLDKHMPGNWRSHHEDMREELAITLFNVWNSPPSD